MNKINKKWIVIMIILLIIIMQGRKEAKKVVGESVIRSLPSSASPGEQITITLTATGTTGDYFAIVRDNIPSGWTYVSGGALEGTQVKGILSSLTGSSLTYILQAPASGTHTFSGTYQFTDDVNPLTIGGDTQISISGVCTPDCTGKECGDDGCGGSCGICPSGENCVSGTCVLSGEGGEVERALPITAQTDEEVSITLTAIGTTGSYFAIVRDNIPSGWTYISGGQLEGTQVKGILSTLTGSSLTYILKSPSSADTSTFTGTYQYTDDVNPVTILGDTQIAISSECTSDWSCTDWSPIICPASCEQTRICTDTNNCGTVVNKPDETQPCTGGSCGVTCECTTYAPAECGTGVYEGQRRFTRSCTPSGCDTEEQYVDDATCIVGDECEFYQTLKDGECKLAGWAIAVIVFMGFMFFMNIMAKM